MSNSYIRYSDSGMGDNELIIDDVFVALPDRGKGKGKELVREAIKFAKVNGYATVGLYAEPQSEGGLDCDALIEFYCSLGFTSSHDDVQLMTLQF